MTAKGIRDNNPLNLRDFKVPWAGLVGNDGGFCVFSTPVAGIRAGTINLLHGFVHNSTKSVRQIIARHAPADDNNPELAYVQFVCAKLGVQPDDWIDLKNRPILNALVNAIIAFEDANYVYPSDVVYEAVDLALSKFS